MSMMTNRLRFAFVGAWAVLLMAAAILPPVAQAAPEVSHFTLKNGLEVVVIPDRRAPVVTHMLWYKVGSADEEPGKSGLAHFLEHLLFKGTEKNPDGRFSKAIAAIGGQENAFTASDYTGYFQRAAPEHLKMLMELEADRMTGLVLTDEVVKPELGVVLEEWNERIGNNPTAQLGQQVEAMLFVNHPYGRPVIGWRPEIAALTRDDALAFYRKHYTPNNAVLVVAGDVNAKEVLALAEATYGQVKPTREVGPRKRPQEPPPEAVRRVTLADARVKQPVLQRAYLVPSAATAEPGQSEALDVLAHILGSGSASRLNRELVMNRGVAVSAGGWYNGTALDQTRLVIYGSPTSKTTLDELEAAIDGVLDEVIAKGVTAEELERSKNQLIADAIFAQDNQATMARWYGAGLTTGLTVEDISGWPDRIRKVTAGDVNAAAKRWFDKRRSVTGYLVPDETKSEAAPSAAKPKEDRS